MKIWIVAIMLLSMNHLFANDAPPDYVSVHPDPAAQEQVTQQQASATQFFAQFEQLRQWLDQDRAEMADNHQPNEGQFWACVRINQLHTLFDNNRHYQAAFNQHYSDMDFAMLMDYWHQDIQNEREACYQSEVFYSDRP